MKRKIFFFVSGCVVLAVLYGLKEYYRTPETAGHKKPVAELTVTELLSAFENKPVQSSQRFVDKVVLVKGTVTAVQAAEKPVVLTLGEKGAMSSVQCSMDSSQAFTIDGLRGKKVNVKGFCTGAMQQEFFGTDVKLSRCVLVNE